MDTQTFGSGNFHEIETSLVYTPQKLVYQVKNIHTTNSAKSYHFFMKCGVYRPIVLLKKCFRAYSQDKSRKLESANQTNHRGAVVALFLAPQISFCKIHLPSERKIMYLSVPTAVYRLRPANLCVIGSVQHKERACSSL